VKKLTYAILSTVKVKECTMQSTVAAFTCEDLYLLSVAKEFRR